MVDARYKINFDCMPCKYWDLHVKMSYIQRRIIVYSLMYYEYNESCVSDAYYDGISKQLVELQKQATPEEWKKTTYYYAMYDFDGSTGFDIPSRLTKEDREWLDKICWMVYASWKNIEPRKRAAKTQSRQDKIALSKRRKS